MNKLTKYSPIIIPTLIKKYVLFICLVLLLIIFRNSCDYFINNLYITKFNRKLKIGIVGVRHEVNVGNNLLKYAMHIIFSKLGFIPYIIGTRWGNYNISFINATTNLIIIKNNFKEIKRDDYDLLLVNSDQTWYPFDKHFYDYGFLKFSSDWNITKFIYGASLGFSHWGYSQAQDIIIKRALKNFKGISVRENSSIPLIKSHLNITPEYVIDPTLLIHKKYYFDIIRNFKSQINIHEKYIFSYKLTNYKKMENFILKSCEKLKYNYHYILLNNDTKIEEFLYLIINCKAVITNSYHGFIFSIIFNKPFIVFCRNNKGKERFITLSKLFGLQDRIVNDSEKADMNLLNKPLNLNSSILTDLKKKSMNFILKNLKEFSKSIHQKSSIRIPNYIY